jgi:hypothetical protein
VVSVSGFEVAGFGPEFREWVRALERLGCVSPVMLMGHTLTRDAHTGEVVHAFRSADLPFGVLMLPCNNRREAVCLPCSLLHNGDSFQIVRSGIVGGKGVPVEVAGHPRAFVTVTAPSFGPVHREGERCRPRRDRPVCPHGRALYCGTRHVPGDPLVGAPLCGECHRYADQVVWNSSAGGLWWRYVRALGRELFRLAGFPVTDRAVREALRVSYVRVAEFQRRGVVHFHAVVRVDGPDGGADEPPAWVTGGLLVQAAKAAGPRVFMDVPSLTGIARIGLGTQLDAQEIGAGGISDQAAASYLAKYVTKDDGRALILPSPLRTEAWIDQAPRGMLTAHARTLMHTAWQLGGREEFGALRLRQWAHQLGFRGNVVTKSRHYSTTYGALRGERAEFRRAAAGVVLPEETVTESRWRFVSKGLSPRLAEIAAGAAEDAAMRKGERPSWIPDDEP